MLLSFIRAKAILTSVREKKKHIAKIGIGSHELSKLIYYKVMINPNLLYHLCHANSVDDENLFLLKYIIST